VGGKKIAVSGQLKAASKQKRRFVFFVLTADC
jgi:hypothetical protein